MNPTTILLILSSALLVIAAVVVLVPVDDTNSEAAPSTGTGFDATKGVQAAWALAIGALILATSGWVLPALVAAGGTWYWVGAYQRCDRTGTKDVERTDALASWIENLRDVLLAGDQPIGAIAATVPTAAPSIRPAVRRLSASLGHQDPDTAFRRFADELDDPLGDLVASVRVVLDLDLGARGDGRLDGVEDLGRCLTEVDFEIVAGLDPEGGGELVEPARKWTVEVGAGHRQESRRCGDECERLLGREPE